jgi:hypothetical protein
MKALADEKPRGRCDTVLIEPSLIKAVGFPHLHGREHQSPVILAKARIQRARAAYRPSLDPGFSPG